jgi:hypothetical protein
MKTTPPVVPPGVPIVGSAVPPPKLPPAQPDHTDKLPMKEIPTPVPIAPAPAPGSPPVTAPTPPSSSDPIPVAPAAPDSSGGAVERDNLMERDSAEPGGESHSLPAQTAFIPPIVTAGTKIPPSPPATIEIESADSAPPVPTKKVRLKGRYLSKKAKMLDPPLTTTRRSVTPPKVPTPPFMTQRLSPLAPRGSNPVPQSQSHAQTSKTPPVFPRLSVFTKAVGPQVTVSQPPPPPLAAPSPNQPASATTQPETPVQLSTPRPYTSAPPDAQEKDKGGRKGFDPLLLQRLVEEKEKAQAGRGE